VVVILVMVVVISYYTDVYFQIFTHVFAIYGLFLLKRAMWQTLVFFGVMYFWGILVCR